VWGLGIVLFGMVFGYAPFGDSPADEAAFDKLCALRLRTLLDNAGHHVSEN
jgi:hypothetical protein